MICPAKTPASQEILGELHDALDKAIGFADCIWHATRSPSSGVEDAGISAVVNDLASQLKAMKATVHGMVDWVE